MDRQLPSKQHDAGSSPVGSTIYFALVVQMDRILGYEPYDASSTLAESTNLTKLR